jgi:prepilin-type N-terminal cleavage/methylation domain-containing protein
VKSDYEAIDRDRATRPIEAGNAMKKIMTNEAESRNCSGVNTPDRLSSETPAANGANGRAARASETGFTLTELVIALAVFTVIMGSVMTLLVKSQAIFRTEQGVSEMDQNARLLIDFLTRDIQQSKENGLGLGARFRSIYSYDGPEGKTDELTIVSSETESKIPSAALPFIPASTKPFRATDRYVEVVPNSPGRVDPGVVVDSLTRDEEFIVSTVLPDSSVQFDFIKIRDAKLNPNGSIGLTFDATQPRGVEPEVSFGSQYENGAFTMRPVSIKRYFVDRKSDKEHPTFALSVNEGEPIPIARNLVAFQLRYLEVADGDLEGRWVKRQNISRDYRTVAVEVTMTARTEIAGDATAQRLVTLASVVRPRSVPEGALGSAGGGGGTGVPGGPGGNGFGDQPGGGNGAWGDDPGGSGSGWGNDGDGFGFGPDDGIDSSGYRHRTRRIGKPPKLGERLNH